MVIPATSCAGFGKTTLRSEWLPACERPVAWLSLDEGGSDLTRFLVYLVSTLQTIVPHMGAEIMGVVQAPQPPPAEAILTALLNDIAAWLFQYPHFGSLG